MNPEEKEKNKDQDEQEASSIKDLEQDLYSRNQPGIIGEERHRLSKSEHSVKEEWKREPEKELKPKTNHRSLSSSIFKKIFIAAAVFFVLAVSISLFIIFGGLNIISSQNIDISINGLTVIEGGEELVLDVVVQNDNRVSMEDVSILVQYPDGAREHRNINSVLTRQQEEIEFIPARGEVSRTFRSVLFGEQNSVKEIRVTVEYTPEGSNSAFSKTETHEVGIRSSPVTVTFSAPKEVSAGQEVDLTVSVASNSNAVIKDLVMSANYPIGFVFSGADPEAEFDNRFWNLGDLNPREKKEISLKGRLEGTENEEKTFRISVGLPNPQNEREVGVEFTSNVESIIIQKPFINLRASIEGSTAGTYISQIGRRLRAEINWRNDLTSDLQDVSLEVKINGAPLDKSSVSTSQDGFYNSVSNNILWNKNNHGVFERIIPGQSGNVSFSFDTLDVEPSIIPRLENGTVDIEVIMRGTRFIESRPPETVSSSISRNVKMETGLSLDPKILYSIGPFANSGPLPPKAEQATTYTVTLTVSNTFNDVEEGLVTATLPLYVDWAGSVHPQGEEVTYNSSTRTVVWNLGNVQAGAGYILPTREASFKISFTPSLNQVGSTPVLLNQSSIVGTDTFTSTNVSSQKGSLTTRMTSDPAYRAGMERVAQ